MKQNTHSIAIVTIADKKYIVDCAYRQFFSTKDSIDTVFSDTMNIEEIMLRTEQGTQVAAQMLKYGFIEATPENLKTYMDGYEMAKRKNFAETGISAEKYLKMLAEDETFPIHIVTNSTHNVTSRQIVEADMAARNNIERNRKGKPFTKISVRTKR